MASLSEGWRIQRRVIVALMSRELTTRFGRENIGFLWIMAEPLLFASLVALVWTVIKGPEEHGVGIVPFVISGYIPLTLLRNSFGRCTSIFVANGSLMYHRQIGILDFVFVRVLIEAIGAMMAYAFIGTVLVFFDLFPVPDNIGLMVGGWAIYALFTLSACLIIAPLSEMSEVLEKVLPVTVYISIPFSGTFFMVSWLTPEVRDFMLWSPMVNAVEMMRSGLFGDNVRPYYDVSVPLGISMVLMVIGLAMCRRVRRTLVVE
jgi:capsular polysaccharide transport system permease protein